MTDDLNAMLAAIEEHQGPVQWVFDALVSLVKTPDGYYLSLSVGEINGLIGRDGNWEDPNSMAHVASADRGIDILRRWDKTQPRDPEFSSSIHLGKLDKNGNPSSDV